MRRCYAKPAFGVEAAYFPDMQSGSLRLVLSKGTSLHELVRMQINSGPGGATVRGALPNRGDEVRAGRRCLGEGRSHQLPAGRLLSCDSRLEPRAIHDSADEQMPRAHSNLAICRSAKSPEVPRSTF
jgi:hypothetical protein